MIEIKNISKELFSDSGLKKHELKNISFAIAPGTITALIGASGSGKTTLLKIISALETSSGGEIINPAGKKIIYLPSEPSSFPWLNVRENITFGLSNYPKDSLAKLISLVELDGYENFFPNNRSLGFRFRISLARSLAHDPALILLDDSFRSMDEQTKKEIFSLIGKINSSGSITFLFATSNISDAILLAGHIYLLRSNMVEGILKRELEQKLHDLEEHHAGSSFRNSFDSILEKLGPEEFSKISF